MTDVLWVALEEAQGKIHIIELIDEMVKIKGLGVFNPAEKLSSHEFGSSVKIGQKNLRVLQPGMVELNKGMKRRAQTISSKDAGFMIAKLGIGTGDTVLEAGLGSGGLSLHLTKVLGNSGTLITVEPRDEHAEVGLENLSRAKSCFQEFPNHHHISGSVEDKIGDVSSISKSLDAIILDLPNHENPIKESSKLLRTGGRMACYCPVTSQMERAWSACEDNGMTVEWAGELIDRQWGRAAKGGMRPVNGPFGHTAFLLIAVKQ